MNEHRSDEEAFCRAIEFIVRLRYMLVEVPCRECADAGKPLGPDGLDMWLKYGTLTTTN